MKHIIVGAAGHIDHGKTALVKALTGIDADRLEEEKRRGITIDLGFAHLQLTPQIRLGFVDVPGHERFIKNMLAGVGGIDLVLFVVAADESIKPQTREHFDICRLLGIQRGVVALTKSDLVDEDILGLVRMEIEDLVAGSFLEGAPIVPVSSVTSAGLDALRDALARVTAGVQEKDARGHFRLPIDRSFTMKGFGAVVTGTLISGAIEKEQEVELYPTGRRLRARGVQVHGSNSGRAIAGQRTAVNLPGIEHTEIERGYVLSVPDRFHPVRHIDCRLQLLPAARRLKHRVPVHFHSGTAEIEAEVRLLGAAASIQPGASEYVRIVLRDPALLLPGDRFIIRMFSPVVTIGGGTVIDIGERRYRRSDDAAARLDVLSSPDLAARLRLIVRESDYGIDLDGLIARTGLRPDEIAAAGLQPLSGRSWFVDPAWYREAGERIVRSVAEFHAANPLQPGIPKQELRSRELPNAPVFLIDALLASSNALVVDGEIVRTRGHKITLKEDEEQARAAIESAFEAAGLAVPALAEVLAKSGIEAGRARTLLAGLLREKRLTRITDDLVFHRSAIGRLRQLLADRKSQRFNVAAFKEWTGVSRKYAIPLLEYLDREHVTRREGDERLVL
jgi:selenocysteine-specific elongation factor